MPSAGRQKRVPVHRTSLFYFLGGMALFLFGIQVATGILLRSITALRPTRRSRSVRGIVTEVDFGWLFRSIHSWSANLLIGVLFLHILTTYIMRAYRRPREVTWITGILLFFVFLAFGFSGYLLPWNQLAFFATRVGTAIAGVVPVVGNYFLLMARGGEDITGDTLARFYALHVVILPLAALGLIGLHLFLVQKHEISMPESAIKKYGGEKKVPSMPFVPDFLLHDMVGWYLALAILARWPAPFPWQLGQKADPLRLGPGGHQAGMVLPLHVPSAQGSSRAFFQIDWLEGEVVGVLFFGFCGAVVLLVPFLDFGASRGRPRRILNFLAFLAVAFFIAMTVRGLVVK